MNYPNKLEDNEKTKLFLETLPKVYMLGCWVRYGVIDYPFAGEFVSNDELGYVPLVYNFDDHNGTCGEWIKTPLTYVTTGDVLMYSFRDNLLKEYANLKNKENEVD